MPITDEDLLDPKREDDLDAQIASMVAAEPDAPAPEPQPVGGLDKLIALARAQEVAGPGAEERRFLAENRPQEGWKRALGAVGAAIAESTGTSGAINSFRAAQERAAQARQQGLAAARATDESRRPVDDATRSLLQNTGISPEALQSMTRGSDALRLAGQLGGLSMRGQGIDAQNERARLALEEKMRQFDAAEAGRNQRAQDALASREKIAADRKKAAAGGGGVGGSPEQRAQRLSGYLVAATSATPEQAQAFAAGSKEGLPPDLLARMEARASAFLGAPPKEQNKMYTAAEVAEAKRHDVLEDAAAKGRGDVKERTKLRTELANTKADVRNAMVAWNSMSPSARQAFAQIAGSSNLMGAIKQMKLSPEDQAHIGAIQALGNALINARAGAAVSESEWSRIAQEMGWAPNDFAVFNSTNGISAWLKRAKDSFERRRAAIKAEYGEDLSLPGGGGG